MIVGLPKTETSSATKINKLIKRFNKINKNIGVNRARVRISHSGRARDSSRDTFEEEKLIKCKIKELNGHPRGFGSDSSIGSGRAGLGGRYTLVVSEPRFRRFWKKALNDFEKDFENGI